MEVAQETQEATTISLATANPLTNNDQALTEVTAFGVLVCLAAFIIRSTVAVALKQAASNQALVAEHLKNTYKLLEQQISVVDRLSERISIISSKIDSLNDRYGK